MPARKELGEAGGSRSAFISSSASGVTRGKLQVGAKGDPEGVPDSSRCRGGGGRACSPIWCGPRLGPESFGSGSPQALPPGLSCGIASLAHSSPPARLRPDLSEAARPASIYFGHPNDTFRGRWCGRSSRVAWLLGAVSCRPPRVPASVTRSQAQSEGRPGWDCTRGGPGHPRAVLRTPDGVLGVI